MFGGGLLLLVWQTDRVLARWRTQTPGGDDTDQRAGLGGYYYQKEFGCGDL